MSPARARVTGRRDRLKPAGASLRELRAMDVLLYSPRGQHWAAMAKTLSAQRDEHDGKLEEALRDNPALAKYLPAIKSAHGRVLDVLLVALREQSSLQGFDFKPEGIRYVSVNEFAPDSETARVLAGVKNTDGPLLTGLPPGPYAVFGGFTRDPRGAATRLDALLAPAEKELEKLGADAAPARELVAAAKQWLGGLTAGAAALSLSNPPVGAGSGQGAAVAETPAKKWALVAVQIGDAHVLTAAGLTDAQLAAAVDATRQRKDPLGSRPDVRAADALLPKSRIGVVYVSLADMVPGLRPQGPRPQPGAAAPNAPALLPPAALSLSTNGPLLRMDLVLPGPTADALLDLALKKLQGQPGVE
jgi:hypothetical protein